MLQVMTALIEYGSPGPLTEFKGINVEILANLGTEPVDLCMPTIRLSFSRVMQSRWPCLQNVSLRIKSAPLLRLSMRCCGSTRAGGRAT